jgi:hypothetical protein
VLLGCKHGISCNPRVKRGICLCCQGENTVFTPPARVKIWWYEGVNTLESRDLVGTLHKSHFIDLNHKSSNQKVKELTCLWCSMCMVATCNAFSARCSEYLTPSAYENSYLVVKVHSIHKRDGQFDLRVRPEMTTSTDGCWSGRMALDTTCDYVSVCQGSACADTQLQVIYFLLSRR